ncbi:putative Restriction modification system DNA specificity domain protein [Desulfamplus magnetovallimortis]|uniref:Putative Restriction modification system DNA specificity domain protein n=1 Tax=Desulfamplus magnetovallimortis TaxID=1246637 RepID=A0A1W1HF60_9BACT|nr:restriction endonuclease subunit S [Desulfamplus magnetovallimortis]SLM31015.1 putative Restriction modification system DNA specificity domain protein [Desulfamplus magnetovallimortis]
MKQELHIPNDWKEASLGKLTSLLTNGFVGTATSHYTKEANGITYIQGFNVTENSFNLTNIRKVTPEFHKKNSKSRLQEGDLLTIQTGDIGLTTIVPKELVGSNCHALVISRLYRETCHPKFYSQYFNSPLCRRLFRRIETGSSMKHLNVGDMKKLHFPIPPLPEQKAIADLLSTWDEAIEKTERLILAKERQKLGDLHSRISSQKANSTIGAFAKPVVRKIDKPEESYVAVGIRSHFKGTFQRLVEDPRTVNMDSLYRVKENDLILNITFAWEGAIALVKKEDEECYVSHRFPTYEIKRSKAEPCFIRQLIMSSRMKYDLSNISPGGAGRNRVLNKKDFLKMPIWLPDLETQKNIGGYLGAIDKEIDLLKQLADKYKTQKRGLMQKMLTGEWRVKPEIVNTFSE